MSTLSDMAEIDQIAHWCYILTSPWPWDIPRLWQGHLKVTARSNQLKKLKIACFFCFSIVTFTSDDKVLLRSQQGQIIYKKLVTIACFCCFCYNYVHFLLCHQNPWADSSMKPTPNPWHHVLVSMGYSLFSPFYYYPVIFSGVFGINPC